MIYDFITCIRNAQMAHHSKVDVPSSHLRQAIANVLKQYGFIRDFRVAKDSKQGILRIYLKYTHQQKPLINVIRLVSKPGLRKYVGVDDIPKVRSGYGLSILSTSKGVLSGEQARKAHVGGEVLIQVW